MKPTNTILDEIKQLEDAATSGPWHLDHDDTFVFADESVKEYYNYWIIGSMEQPETEHNPALEDIEFRGPQLKENCRFIAESRTLIPRLRSALEVIDEHLTDSCYCNQVKLSRGCGNCVLGKEINSILNGEQ